MRDEITEVTSPTPMMCNEDKDTEVGVTKMLLAVTKRGMKGREERVGEGQGEGGKEGREEREERREKRRRSRRGRGREEEEGERDDLCSLPCFIL